MTEYSPFKKNLSKLVAKDIQVLTTVTEGWYIEYKRELTNSSSIAKSITAFANTYGGWLFFGIAEKSKEEEVAGSFLGISISEVDAAFQRVRQAIANHCQPSPYFETKAIYGPESDIGLDADKAIIVIKVPMGLHSPYVHKDGRIYRRVSAGSEPKPENDRFILDQLWKRSEPIRQKYTDWIESDPVVSEDESDNSYLRLLLVADLWQNQDVSAELNLTDVRNIVGKTSESYTIPFDTVSRFSDGFICRQVKNNNPELLGLTWRFRNNLQSEVIIPLPKKTMEPFRLLPEMEGYECADRFVKVLHKQGFTSPTVIDLNFLFQVLLGVMHIQKQFMKRASWDGPIYVKMKLTGIWRSVPFVDAPHVLDEYELHGVPLCLDDEMLIDRGTELESFVMIEASEFEVDDNRYRMLAAVNLFIKIALSWSITRR